MKVDDDDCDDHEEDDDDHDEYHEDDEYHDDYNIDEGVSGPLWQKLNQHVKKV